MELGLKGKRVIVTGGSRGIGRAIALGFAAEGAAVSVCARGAEGVDAAVAEIGKTGAKAHGAPCDVSDGDALKAYIDSAAAALGGLDILVNNPSGFGISDDEDGWKKSVDVDLMATVHGSWAALPHFEKAGGGSMIHISSISGLGPSAISAPYGAVKAAIIQLTQTQAIGMAKQKVRVNCVAPGSIYFDGGAWDQIRQHNKPMHDATLASIPWGRFGTPDEVANLVVYLGSDAASWVTGQTIAVDGAQNLS